MTEDPRSAVDAWLRASTGGLAVDGWDLLDRAYREVLAGILTHAFADTHRVRANLHAPGDPCRLATILAERAGTPELAAVWDPLAAVLRAGCEDYVAGLGPYGFGNHHRPLGPDLERVDVAPLEAPGRIRHRAADEELEVIPFVVRLTEDEAWRIAQVGGFALEPVTWPPSLEPGALSDHLASFAARTLADYIKQA